MKPVVVVHHHEITLKKDNRAFFEKQLLQNIKFVLSKAISNFTIRGGYGRFIIEFEDNNNVDKVLCLLRKVFGLANICWGLQVEQNIETFCRTAGHILEGQNFTTIRVVTKRIDKTFSASSLEVNEKVGEYLCKKFNVKANLKEPDKTIYIEIVNGFAYIYQSKINGAGGLPVGVSGKVVGLLSAGFDSPVASWQMMRRGAVVIFVHFHSVPYTSRNSIDQVKQIVRILTSYQFRAKLYLIPFAEIQNEIVLQAPEKYRVILYRRMMIRIAEQIAKTEKAEALVTGETVGQVASQTLRNIRAVNEVASLPIIRPLAGTDKEEIVALARQIGTYDISKEPYDDCCSYLTPRHPTTFANLNEIKECEEKLNVLRFLETCISKATIERFAFTL